jgi:hypothetical protein
MTNQIKHPTTQVAETIIFDPTYPHVRRTDREPADESQGEFYANPGTVFHVPVPDVVSVMKDKLTPEEFSQWKAAYDRRDEVTAALNKRNAKWQEQINAKAVVKAFVSRIQVPKEEHWIVRTENGHIVESYRVGQAPTPTRIPWYRKLYNFLFDRN